MNLSHLNQICGSYKDRKRVGRGHGSGVGKTSGRGHNGAGQRAGSKYRPHHEGGQTPLYRRFPKRGFSNAPFRVRYDVLNLEDLNAFENGETVRLETVLERKLLKPRHGRLKILARGELTKKLSVEAAKFSEEARRKIEERGGEAKVV
ncbi:MAG: 50S ribosomal protein L15 [Planctomycetota bacterium]